jgi:DNA-directed RNA polymerase subunit beta
MPFLPDGTPVEIVLNPLGVPSRMNVGQILETHLGWAAGILGFEAKTPVFQGASEDEIGVLLKLAGLEWAQNALDLRENRLGVGVDRIRTMVSEAQALPAQVVGRSRNGNGKNGGAEGKVSEPWEDASGVGRTLDVFAEKPGKEGKAFLDEVHKFVVGAAKEIAERQGVEVGELFPAVEAIARRRTAGPGLDDAAIELMRYAGIFPNGKVWLRDGRSGRRFDFPVTVGQIYMLKLSHLVDDKIHARSIGPYSLVTQQPLAGKAQFGGQRFGEMEVWALEAYGAAHTLQEILTVKSDDVQGRSKVYEAIVKGDNLPEPGIPESFNVLVKELQALGLSVTLGREE